MEPASRVSEFKKTTGNSMISCLNFLMDGRFAQISANQQTNKHAEHPTISACPLRSGTVTCTFKIKHSIVVLGSTQVKASQISKSLWSPRTKRGHFQNRNSIWISMNLLLPTHLTFEHLNYSNLFFHMSLAESYNQSIKLELDLTGRLVVMSRRGCTLGVAVRWSTKDLKWNKFTKLLETFSANMKENMYWKSIAIINTPNKNWCFEVKDPEIFGKLGAVACLSFTWWVTHGISGCQLLSLFERLTRIESIKCKVEKQAKMDIRWLNSQKFF